MLKRMRWRFISAAMISVFVVMLILVAAINLINYSTVTKRQDQAITAIMEFDTGGVGASDRIHFPNNGWFGPPSPEAQFTTRFFSVRCDADGTIDEIKTDFIGSVSETEASDYAKTVLRKNRVSGYIGEYRYMIGRDNGLTYLVFLNSANELQLMRSLLLISIIVAFVSLLATFILVLLLSRRAINPYVKNIEAQKQFITDASHEIKTPLTSISTSADVLAVEYENNEWVKNIRKQSIRLTRLVNNLVALSRLDEAKPFPDKSSFSLSDAAWETAEPFSSLAEANGKNFSYRIEDGLNMVGDKNAIQQMISILLDNAVRYSADGGQIQFDVYQKGSKRMIEVFNTCAPMCVEDVEHIFDRFYRPDKSRSSYTGGTGIGLAIAKATVEGHGGKISVKCPSGNTIRFVISL